MTPDMIPRVQARVGQADSDNEPDVANKWFFEIVISFLGMGQIGEPFQIGPWETEKKAHEEMKNAVKLVVDKVVEQTPGAVPGKYYDMKTNEVRSWDEH